MKKKSLGCKRALKTGALGLVFLCALFASLVIGSGFDSVSVSHAYSPVAYASSPTAGNMPASFAGLVKELSPTVVNVKVTKVKQLSGPGWQMQPGNPFGDLFQHFFRGMPQLPEQYRMQGAGSGVIIKPDGYIITNNHVVENATEVTVTLSDKDDYKAQVVGRDPKTDLALLKIDAGKSLPAAAMGDSDKLQIGDWVLAIGNPFGLSHTVTCGIVSAKGRVIGEGPYDDFIQTDASINPGNSGGPLFNLKGQLVGINTAIIANGQGIGFAIPVNTAKPLIPQLMKSGEVTRGYLGVSIQSVTPELDQAFKLNGREGALVAEVTDGSPASRAGVRRGDLIVSFDQKPVKDARSLSFIVAQTPVDKKVEMTIVREGNEKTLSVKVGKLDSDETEGGQTLQQTQGKWGLWLQELDRETADRLGVDKDKGVLVAKVDPDSPAGEAGVRQGDVLLEVNRTAVNSVKEAKDLLSKGGNSALLLLRRQEGSFYVAMKVE